MHGLHGDVEHKTRPGRPPPEKSRCRWGSRRAPCRLYPTPVPAKTPPSSGAAFRTSLPRPVTPRPGAPREAGDEPDPRAVMSPCGGGFRHLHMRWDHRRLTLSASGREHSTRPSIGRGGSEPPAARTDGTDCAVIVTAHDAGLRVGRRASAAGGRCAQRGCGNRGCTHLQVVAGAGADTGLAWIPRQLMPPSAAYARPRVRAAPGRRPRRGDPTGRFWRSRGAG